jgi:phosphoserine phosphatase
MPKAYAVTLVAPPRSGSIFAEALKDLQGEARFAGETLILAEDEAGDIPLHFEDESEAEGYRQLLRLRTRDLPLDYCLQPASNRRKHLLVADMDSTIIGQECLDELAALKGIKPEVAAITEAAMRGEIGFGAALRKRLALLEGLGEDEARGVLASRITLNPGARVLARSMAAHGARTVLVSGGFTLFVEEIARRAGFAAFRANRFLWRDGRLCGVEEPILGANAKHEALLDEAASHGLTPADALAVGDGANDIAMLKAAGLGVAWRAKPAVAAAAHAQVNHTSLATLLYFQGYRAAEFVHD